MKWKHTRERLSKNNFCGAIINEHAVFCICRQKVLLDKDYDDSQLNEYSRSSRCKLNNKKQQLGLSDLFPILPNKKTKNTTLELLSPSLINLTLNIPYPEFISEQIKTYIN
ncbi:4322_t:CDS:1 [Funneliformis mosseae]|uniref:4322_t:CDS:1 n=1 Tax=Funneliformis mosseae TaxID=27381 RepID=A0A9N9GH27_FUNMO|nr:4322_t:CDS:1 [Funneliformis mosseae]